MVYGWGMRAENTRGSPAQAVVKKNYAALLTKEMFGTSNWHTRPPCTTEAWT